MPRVPLYRKRESVFPWVGLKQPRLKGPLGHPSPFNPLLGKTPYQSKPPPPLRKKNEGLGEEPSRSCLTSLNCVTPERREEELRFPPTTICGTSLLVGARFVEPCWMKPTELQYIDNKPEVKRNMLWFMEVLALSTGHESNQEGQKELHLGSPNKGDDASSMLQAMLEDASSNAWSMLQA